MFSAVQVVFTGGSGPVSCGDCFSSFHIKKTLRETYRAMYEGPHNETVRAYGKLTVLRWLALSVSTCVAKFQKTRKVIPYDMAPQRWGKLQCLSRININNGTNRDKCLIELYSPMVVA